MDKDKVLENFTQIIAYSLNRQDNFPMVVGGIKSVVSYDELSEIDKVAFIRYQQDAGFHARVKTIVSQLMIVLDKD